MIQRRISLMGLALAGAILVSGFVLRPQPEVKSVTYTVDSQASTIGWKAYKVGGQHFGSIKLSSGTVTFTDGALSGGTFEMDMASMTIEDIQGDMNARLLNHLKSDDFFGVASHTSAKLVITQVAKGDAPGKYRVTGDMTIKGITKPVQFDAFANADKAAFTAEAFIKVNRTNYDIKYRSSTFFADIGDRAIMDEFDLNIKLAGAKK
ncbi:MAG: YceI family protein [Bacteroidia bacterium]|nr:YceI family protein [Bacteroidia bacterium]